MVNKKLVHWALVSCLFVDLKGERSELPENYDNNKLIIIPGARYLEKPRIEKSHRNFCWVTLKANIRSYFCENN